MELITTVTIDGMTVEIHADRDERGTSIVLGGRDCNLEGDYPGEYLLVKKDHAAASSAS